MTDLRRKYDRGDRFVDVIGAQVLEQQQEVSVEYAGDLRVPLPAPPKDGQINKVSTVVDTGETL